MISDDHFVEQQPRVGLAKSRIVRPKTIAEELAEPADYIGRNATLAGGELSLQRGNVRCESCDALTMMGQAFGEVSIAFAATWPKPR